MLTTVANELDRLDNWLLCLECDHMLPPWSFPKDVFNVYIEDLLEDTDGESAIEPWRDPPTGWFDSDDLASWELLHRSHAAMSRSPGNIHPADSHRVLRLFPERPEDR